MPPSRNALRPRLRRGLAGLPVVAQAAGPIRPRRLELPVLQPVACEVRYALQRLRRRQRLWRIAQRLHPPPERREHAQAPVLLVADLARRSQQVAGKAMRDDTDLAQRRGNLICHGPVWRLRDLVPVDRLGTDLARERGDDRRRRPLAQHQRCPPLTQARLQGAQRLRQPPSRRAAERPNARRLVVEHVNERNRRVRFGGCVQRGMVGNAEVVAVPDDGGVMRA